jgi:hypothetical protein
MPYLNEIVDIVNTTLATGKLKTYNRKLFGVSELLPRNFNNAQDTIPALVTNFGSTMFSGFDDKFDIVIYHRCLSTTIEEGAVLFGDGLNTAREVAEMRMLVFGNRKKLSLQPQQLSFLLSSGVQQQLASSQISNYAGLFGCIIEANTTNYDGVGIFTSEYKLAASRYPVHPEHIYLALDYTITTDYDITCINDCSNC